MAYVESIFDDVLFNAYENFIKTGNLKYRFIVGYDTNLLKNYSDTFKIMVSDGFIDANYIVDGICEVLLLPNAISNIKLHINLKK